MNKITFLIIAAIFCGTLSIYAQDEEFFAPPDYRQIQRNIQDIPSSFYYPRLMSRFLAGDHTMSREEMRHLYFGFVFQPEFASLDDAEYNRLLANVLRRPIFSEQDLAEILRLSQALLEKDPFNLRALNAQMIVHLHHENMTEYARVAWQRHIVQNAIASTGDGMSPQTPFFVIRTAHQYDVLQPFGFEFGGRSQLAGNRGIRGLFSRSNINSLSVRDNMFGVQRIYFDISPTVRRM